MSELLTLIDKIKSHPRGSTVEISASEKKLLDTLMPLFPESDHPSTQVWNVTVKDKE